MKKSDLKTGYRVTLRNGDSYICLIGTDTDYFSGDALVDPREKSYNWIDLSEYNDEMNEKLGADEYDIVMVEKPSHPYDILWDFEGFTIIWERIVEFDNKHLADSSFEITGHFNDWLDYTSEEGKKYWDELPKETRLLLYEQAKKQADMEEEWE